MFFKNESVDEFHMIPKSLWPANPFPTDLFFEKFNRRPSIKKKNKLCISRFLATHKPLAS